MYYPLVIIATSLLVMIAYQDYTARAVAWIFFPLLAATGTGLSYISLHSLNNVGMNSLLNLGFLALQLILLKGYFYIRNKSGSALIDKKLGLGDILFLVAACFFFSPLNFIVFYICSLIFSICVFLGWTWTKNNDQERTVPLAGLQAAFFLAVLFICGYLQYSLTDDALLLFKIRI